MNCLTDSICSLAALIEMINSATAAIDYTGAVFFGEQWQAIGPDIAASAAAFEQLMSDFFAKPPGGCQRYASLGSFNG